MNLDDLQYRAPETFPQPRRRRAPLILTVLLATLPVWPVLWAAGSGWYAAGVRPVIKGVRIWAGASGLVGCPR